MRPNLHRNFPADSVQLNEDEEKKQNLAAQVSEIAERISRLHRIVGDQGNVLTPIVDAEMLRRMLVARRARGKFFADGLFSDPAWDMLLDLLMTQLDNQRITITNLCAASNVPATTALRWIKTLDDGGLISRRADPLDGRRFFVELTTQASESLRSYFTAIGHKFVI